LPEDFHETTMMHIPVDQENLVCTLLWGRELKMAPFFGVMGVAPPPALGRIMSKKPRKAKRQDRVIGHGGCGSV
jgi:acetamidase/formamidase